MAKDKVRSRDAIAAGLSGPAAPRYPCPKCGRAMKDHEDYRACTHLPCSHRVSKLN